MDWKKVLGWITILGGLYYLATPHQSIIASGFGLYSGQHGFHQLLGIGMTVFGVFRVKKAR